MKQKPPTKCKHYWRYKHTIWDSGRRDSVAIGRYCSLCGRIQTATISDKDWHPLPKSYVDMRETLKKELNK